MKKKKNEKICKNKEYEIKNHYFYANEFLKWLETQEIKGFSALNVKFNERWKYILQFDSFEIIENVEIINDKQVQTNYRSITKSLIFDCGDEIF